MNRNINACKEFAESLRSAYGPCGMNKMIINHIEKLFVTNDAGTIMHELDVSLRKEILLSLIIVIDY